MSKRKKKSPRLVVRRYGVASWDMMTAHLRGFRQALGGDVLVAFVRCFTLADRLESLKAWESLSEKHLSGHEVQRRRNYDTFLWFTFATLREFAKATTYLGEQLRAEGLIDEALWERSLGKYDAMWAKDSRVQLMRDKGGSHVDLAVLRSGLDAIESGKHLAHEKAVVINPRLGKGLLLMRGDHKEWREDSAFVLGSAAILTGLGLTLDELKEVVSLPIEMVRAADALHEAFEDVVRRRGLAPLGITRTKRPGRKSTGGKSGDGSDSSSTGKKPAS